LCASPVKVVCPVGPRTRMFIPELALLADSCCCWSRNKRQVKVIAERPALPADDLDLIHATQASVLLASGVVALPWRLLRRRSPAAARADGSPMPSSATVTAVADVGCPRGMLWGLPTVQKHADMVCSPRCRPPCVAMCRHPAFRAHYSLRSRRGALHVYASAPAGPPTTMRGAHSIANRSVAAPPWTCIMIPTPAMIMPEVPRNARVLGHMASKLRAQSHSELRSAP